jgi:hypothetical protein
MARLLTQLASTAILRPGSGVAIHGSVDVAIDARDIDIRDTYAGGYGYVRTAKMEAVRLLAETEGLILDPVSTASAMACLIDLCRAGHFKKSDTVAFVNTGGQAGLFPYEAPLHAAIEGHDPPWTVPPPGIRKRGRLASASAYCRTAGRPSHVPSARRLAAALTHARHTTRGERTLTFRTRGVGGGR